MSRRYSAMMLSGLMVRSCSGIHEVGWLLRFVLENTLQLLV
jgi:hypothetical protein